MITSSRNRGFSLVEVTLSLGIISFCSVAVLGLSVLTLDQTRESKRDVIWINVAQNVTAKLRTTLWSDLSFPQEQYFDADGKSVTTLADAIYICRVKEGDAAITGTPTDSIDYRKSVLLELEMKTAKEKRIIPLILSKYE